MTCDACSLDRIDVYPDKSSGFHLPGYGVPLWEITSPFQENNSFRTRKIFHIANSGPRKLIFAIRELNGLVNKKDVSKGVL